MAVKIRLKRFGKKKAPFYRVIVIDSRAKRDGRALEEIGKYHPLEQPSVIEIDSERAQYWLSVGAQPSDQVRQLLTLTGDWGKYKGDKNAESTVKAPEGKQSPEENIKALADEAEKRKAAEAEAKDKAKKEAEAEAKAAEDAAAAEAAGNEGDNTEPLADEAAASEDAPADGATTNEPSAEDAAPAVVDAAPAEDAAAAAPAADNEAAPAAGGVAPDPAIEENADADKAEEK